MNNDEKVRLVRRPQTITPFGTGAIIDIEGESFVAADVSRWSNKGLIIREPRLEKLLGVKNFRMAPAAPEFFWNINDKTPGVPYVRFPRWMFCSQCRRMYWNWSKKDAPRCEQHQNRPKLTPMRFVMACPRGHLDDVDWIYWAHSLRGGRCEDSDLRFITESGGSGLEFVFIRCDRCGAGRSLAGIATPDSLRSLKIKCPGRHPWRPLKEKEECDAIPQVLQRGATNLTFALIESAIDITQDSDEDEYSTENTAVKNHSLYNGLKTAYEYDNEDFIKFCIGQISRETEVPEKIVRKIFLKDMNESASDTGRKEDVSSSEITKLYEEEYEALTEIRPEIDSRENFVKRDVDYSEYPEEDASSEFVNAITELEDNLDQLVKIPRLREVRVLRAFSRLSPPAGAEDLDDEPPGRFSLYNSDKKISPKPVPADLRKLPYRERFLPAIEVFGEGIFVTLDQDRLEAWENESPILGRLEQLASRQKKYASYLPPVTPRLVLLHTLSHLLIRELSFEVGYSIASMRERIYAGNNRDEIQMAGIMIYTSAGDAEGTLGGLVRQGDPDRLFPVVLRAIQNSVWCSSDPLCRESEGQGLFALNLAACHACSLLPETSCTMSNRLLDRVMLSGSLDKKIPGFFSPLIDIIYQEGFDTLITGG